MNTPSSGRYRWMIFKEDDAWIGVALEFNIVVTGDDPKVVEFELGEAVQGYLESAKKLKDGFRPNQVNAILNQTTDDEYEARWNQAQQATIAESLPDVYKSGFASLAFA